MKNRVEKVSDLIPVRRVLISVSDKSGLDSLILGLSNLIPGVEIYSTGGTYSAIQKMLQTNNALTSSIVLREVSEYTGQPETQGGLVKTLDFKIYLGLLTEEHNPAHKEDLGRTGSHFFDLVVVNLYPFEETIRTPGSDLEDARGNIDIGGPTMIRAAAKNFLRVGVVTDSQDYGPVLTALKKNSGSLNLETRFELSKKAFGLIADYDRAISNYLSTKGQEELALYRRNSG